MGMILSAFSLRRAVPPHPFSLLSYQNAKSSPTPYPTEISRDVLCKCLSKLCGLFVCHFVSTLSLVMMMMIHLSISLVHNWPGYISPTGSSIYVQLDLASHRSLRNVQHGLMVQQVRCSDVLHTLSFCSVNTPFTDNDLLHQSNSV